MDRGIDRVLVAKVGAVAFAWALTAPVVLTGSTTRTEAVSVASVVSDELVPLVHIVFTPATTSASTGVSSSIADLADVPQLPVRTAVLDATDGVVLASWYGPGFYGRRTACGQTYTAEIVGVAHRVLRCGTLVQITSPTGITLSVPVIDRGPYITGRTLDLSNATKIALACRDLCRVRMVVLQ